MNDVLVKSKRGLANVSPERRKEISAKAIKTRWENPVVKATHGSEEHPLIIGGIKIPCFVLSDGKRVLVQKGVASSIGFSNPNSSALTTLVNTKIFGGFLSESTLNAISNPIRFKTPSGAIANGYDASILVDICESILCARREGRIQRQQEKIANQCEILMTGFAKTGIIALVDEVTGYQETRTKDALSIILEAFISKELQPYTKTFPIDYYKELFRLQGIEFNADSIKSPWRFGILTNNIIYKRLAPGLLEELKRIAPRNSKGNKSIKYFQNLSMSEGYKRLTNHLGSVVTLMKLSKTYDEFIEKLNFIHPLFAAQADNEIEQLKDSSGL